MDTRRKDEHIAYAMQETSDRNVFDDIHILYNSIPELDFDDIDPSIQIFGRKFSYPVMINAMTGGTDQGTEINGMLSKAAAAYNIPMAVGSQTVAIKDKSAAASFRVAREVNRQGFIFANVGAGVPLEYARAAVEMIEADGLQLHLNVLQELLMPEGDRHFRGIIDNIQNIRQNINVPLVVKEVGFGMTKETVIKLKEAGIDYIDIGGYGGTNFARIESLRQNDRIVRDLHEIGIPTAVSLYQACRVKGGMKVICGGGIRTGLDAAKAIMLGADAVSIAYPLLMAIKISGESGLYNEINRLFYELKVSMIVSGASDISELSGKKVVVTGRTLEWIEQG